MGLYAGAHVATKRNAGRQDRRRLGQRHQPSSHRQSAGRFAEHSLWGDKSQTLGLVEGYSRLTRVRFLFTGQPLSEANGAKLLDNTIMSKRAR
jgi:hypothetical protein